MLRPFLALFPAALMVATAATPPAAQAKTTAAPSRSAPLLFETTAAGGFAARGMRSALELKPEGATLHLAGRKGDRRARLSSQVVGGREVTPIGEAPAGAKLNYLLGSDRSKWRTGVRTWGRVRYPAVYPGIDLVYYGRDGELEYDFVVNPGASPERIRVRLEGAERVSLLPSGYLSLSTAVGEVRHRKPVVYQETGNGRRYVAAAYRLGEDGREVRFDLGAYDQNRPLVIDPVIDFFSYHGSGGPEYGTKVAVDSTGAIYMTGRTWSTEFATVGSAQPTFGGGNLSDAFVTKLDPTGTRILYTTYLGGTGQDIGYGIAVDGSRAVVVCGETGSTNFPVSASAAQDTLAGDRDAFIARLSPDGSTVQYATYLGGTGTDIALSVAVKTNGTAYVVGTSRSRSSFPLLNALFSSSPSGYHGFLAVYDPSGGRTVTTFLGATDGQAIVHDVVLGGGGVYVAGQVNGAGVPIPPQTTPFQRTKLGSFGLVDAFVMRLNEGVTVLQNATHLGGTGQEGTMYALGPDDGDAVSLSVASDGSVIVAGRTQSTDFPLQNALQSQHRGGTWDGWVARLNGGLSALTYGTYLGGTEWDEIRDVAIAPNNTVYAVGMTFSTDLAVKAAIQPQFGGGRMDGWLAAINPGTGGSASLIYLTYLGGSRPNGSLDWVGSDHANGVAADASNRAVVVGMTSSNDMPITFAFNGSVGGVLHSLGSQIFVGRIDPRKSLPTAKIQAPKSLNLGNASNAVMTLPFKELKLKNTGRNPLRVHLQTDSIFEIVGTRPLRSRLGTDSTSSSVILPGETEVLKVRLLRDPMNLPSPGVKKGTIKFLTNDPSKRTVSVKVQVKVTS